eukprot:TRINITY_DN56425_c0_g1_i1.p1 TRINITY_DN56425_c0_g1~~TRINITY_DN56425_c0_g1_i1.p1  ORF type:complete len:193 (-),score=26.19 TRINITY_DN56425_c0_g1_i1:240-818(-)
MTSFLAVGPLMGLVVGASAVVCNYPGGECYEMRLQKCKGSDKWTLHGLWPQWKEDCKGPHYDESKLASIRSTMETEWKSCPEMGKADTSFWSHEWTKHGSCSGMDELTYFKTTLHLYETHVSQCNGDDDHCAVCFDKDLNLQETCSDGRIAGQVGKSNSTHGRHHHGHHHHSHGGHSHGGDNSHKGEDYIVV